MAQRACWPSGLSWSTRRRDRRGHVHHLAPVADRADRDPSSDGVPRAGRHALSDRPQVFGGGRCVRLHRLVGHRERALPDRGLPHGRAGEQHGRAAGHTLGAPSARGRRVDPDDNEVARRPPALLARQSWSGGPGRSGSSPWSVRAESDTVPVGCLPTGDRPDAVGPGSGTAVGFRPCCGSAASSCHGHGAACFAAGRELAVDRNSPDRACDRNKRPASSAHNSPVRFGPELQRPRLMLLGANREPLTGQERVRGTGLAHIRQGLRLCGGVRMPPYGLAGPDGRQARRADSSDAGRTARWRPDDPDRRP